MDQIWRELPSHVSDKICDKLIHVRRIDDYMKTELKFGLLDILCKRLDRLFHKDLTNVIVMDTILEILGLKIKYAVFNSDDPIIYLIESLWDYMTPDDIIKFYEFVENTMNSPF